MISEVFCPRCNGAKKLAEDKEPCWLCRGHGRMILIPKQKAVKPKKLATIRKGGRKDE